MDIDNSVVICGGGGGWVGMGKGIEGGNRGEMVMEKLNKIKMFFWTAEKVHVWSSFKYI